MAADSATANTDNSASFPPASTEAIPSPAERRNSLEKHLQQRPDPKELKEKHILLDTSAAPALQSAQQELERQRNTDSLKKGLATRPERELLVERNILPNSTAAPALQPHQKELERHMRKDSLEKQLQRRPSAGQLVRDGILVADEAGDGESAVKD